MIILDTGCIDFLFDGEHEGLSQFTKKSIDNGEIVTTTVFNYAERESGFKHWERQGYVQEKTRYFWKKILDFFDILKENNDLLYPSEKTAQIYADLHFALKNNKNSNVSKGELKNMHNDLWIASLAIEHTAIIYTKNKKDFEKIKIIDKRLRYKHLV